MTTNKMKYARIERERRFLLHKLPDGLTERPFTLITDYYLPHTRLRLRRMTDESGAVTALKLTQKFSPTAVPTTHTTITNTYLNQTEYKLLSQLGGHILIKRRYRFPNAGYTFSIDLFDGDLAGLIVAEIEAKTDADLEAVPLPAWAVVEITEEIFFTGGNLATATPAQLQAKLTAYGI